MSISNILGCVRDPEKSGRMVTCAAARVSRANKPWLALTKVWQSNALRQHHPLYSSGGCASDCSAGCCAESATGVGTAAVGAGAWLPFAATPEAVVAATAVDCCAESGAGGGPTPGFRWRKAPHSRCSVPGNWSKIANRLQLGTRHE